MKRFISKMRNKNLQKAFKTLYSNQSRILEITNFIMTNPETKFIYSAISDCMYMEYRDVICKIERESIIITNGLYSYNISVDESIIYNLSKKYVSHMESRKRSIDKKVIEKLTTSLDKIQEQLTH